MHYLVGDIHGMFAKLKGLMKRLGREMASDDVIIFVGDYIDRGRQSFEVVEYLLEFSQSHPSVFLKGNHEELLLDYLDGRNDDSFLLNGGDATIQSYKKHVGRFRIPARHYDFFNTLRLYHEEQDFIAVHAGLPPDSYTIETQSAADLLWIREKFYRNPKIWDRTVIFGHTPTFNINGKKSVYVDARRNIIGIDTGAVYGGPLSCVRMPDRKVFHY